MRGSPSYQEFLLIQQMDGAAISQVRDDVMGKTGEGCFLIEGTGEDTACLSKEGKFLPRGLLAAQGFFLHAVGCLQFGGASLHPRLQLAVECLDLLLRPLPLGDVVQGNQATGVLPYHIKQRSNLQIKVPRARCCRPHYFGVGFPYIAEALDQIYMLPQYLLGGPADGGCMPDTDDPAGRLVQVQNPVLGIEGDNRIV